MRHQIETPDYRQDGEYRAWTGDPRETPVYVFVRGWTGGGAEMCSHISAKEVSEQVAQKLGRGVLVDDGVNLWWETTELAGPLDDVGL